jgi:hypothetical protein
MSIMDLLYSIFFGAGAAAFMYAKFGRRIGYGNAKQVWMMVAVVFVITFIVFFTVSRYFIPTH